MEEWTFSQRVTYVELTLDQHTHSNQNPNGTRHSTPSCRAHHCIQYCFHRRHSGPMSQNFPKTNTVNNMTKHRKKKSKGTKTCLRVPRRLSQTFKDWRRWWTTQLPCFGMPTHYRSVATEFTLHHPFSSDQLPNGFFKIIVLAL